MAKKKVAILGGGIGGLTTAWQLTNDHNWGDKFESITVYQMGWRLGGKCATGRGECGRVEEHGIHLFGGGYYNALTMMRDVYRERYGVNGDKEFDRCFQQQFTSVSVEGNAKSSTLAPHSPLSLDNIPNIAPAPGHWLADALLGLRRHMAEAAPPPALLTAIVSGGPAAAAQGLALVDQLEQQTRSGTAALPATLAAIDLMTGPPSQLLPALPQLPHAFALTLAPPRWLKLFNFISALYRGWQKDIFTGHKSFASLDAQDYADWLKSHGAWDSTIELDIVQAPIRILYQYVGGDSGNPGKRSMGAGAYLHWTLRTFAYMESPFWFFLLGTGDTVITPLYETLARRGVHFEFFRKVENLQLDSTGKNIARVMLRKQATTPGNQPYQPLEGGNWPSKPRYDQLEQGDELRQLPPGETESYWSGYRKNETTDLVAGADFHVVVLAISLGAIPFICKELLAKEQAWRDMVSHIKTVETQSLQIWLDQTSEDLGVNVNMTPPISLNDTGLGAGFAKPFDGFSDFSDLIHFEQWPAQTQPKALWYFSDVARTGADQPDLNNPDYPQDRHNDVFANAKRFLEHDLGRLLSSFSGGFNYDRLVPTDPNPSNVNTPNKRLAQQWIRANVQPSERYVQALAGTTRFRLDAGQSAHFGNLLLAGDWTYNGLNVGCVEATVMSGKLAGNDILGVAHDAGVICYFVR